MRQFARAFHKIFLSAQAATFTGGHRYLSLLVNSGQTKTCCASFQIDSVCSRCSRPIMIPLPIFGCLRWFVFSPLLLTCSEGSTFLPSNNDGNWLQCEHEPINEIGESKCHNSVLLRSLSEQRSRARWSCRGEKSRQRCRTASLRSALER